MNRWFVALFVLVAVVLTVSLGALVMLSNLRATGRPVPQIAGSTPTVADALAPDQGFDGMVVPDFALVDQDNRPVDASIFDGRVTIADFIFTNCPFVCPGMSAAMQDLAAKLAGTDVRFVSISVDPERDTPAQLRDYATRHQADTARWRFLTGDRATVERILRDALLFEVQERPETQIPLADGTTMSNILHPSHLALIGPDRRVLALYLFSSQDQLDQLESRARAGAARVGGR